MNAEDLQSGPGEFALFLVGLCLKANHHMDHGTEKSRNSCAMHKIQLFTEQIDESRVALGEDGVECGNGVTEEDPCEDGRNSARCGCRFQHMPKKKATTTPAIRLPWCLATFKETILGIWVHGEDGDQSGHYDKGNDPNPSHFNEFPVIRLRIEVLLVEVKGHDGGGRVHHRVETG